MKTMLLTVSAIALLGLSPAIAADAAAGKIKAAACAGCHGANGQGTAQPHTKLAGMSEDEFIKAMGEYKSGARNNAVMKSFASQLNETDTANVAAYYASLK